MWVQDSENFIMEGEPASKRARVEEDAATLPDVLAPTGMFGESSSTACLLRVSVGMFVDDHYLISLARQGHRAPSS
jgi:hypothetical protein